jgi:alanine racemase
MSNNLQNTLINSKININAIKHNINYLKTNTKTELMPIIKANAYGHGLIPMANILRNLGIKYIGVATLGEAILLRNSGDSGRILSWLYNINGNELLEAFNKNIDIAISDETIIPQFIEKIPNNKKINVHMFIDTGINRAGISYDKAYNAFIEVNKCNKIELVGMMSHLICSGIKNSPIVNEQLYKFRELRQKLKDINIIPPLVHIANTGGCLNYDVSDFTISRPGSGIYGISANYEPNENLMLAMTLSTYIIQIKNINKGECIGYDSKYIATQNMQVCILPIGYADIIPRNTSLKLNVYINGIKRSVLGLISMDQIIVESSLEDKLGDESIIFGDGINCPQTIYDISKLSKTIPLEILCRIGYRINISYVK